MSSALAVAILAVSSLVTSFISGILGMAGGLILMGILMAMMSVPAAMMMHGITQLASNAWRAFLWRTYVDWKVIRGYFYGSFAMLALFAVTQLVLSKPLALIAMGLTPFLALALPESLHLNVERKGHASACGLVCTILSLTAGVSGPILDIFFVRSAMTRHAVVATKAMTQSLSHLMKIGYFGGILTVGRGQVEPAIGAMMVVLALAGTTMSTRVLEKMNDKSFRMWTRRVVMTIGVFYLGSGIVLLFK
jgi:uncharacterized membrane protein YfcA